MFLVRIACLTTTLFNMMTSSNGNIFRVTGPLCGEFTGPGEFPTQRPVTRSFDVYFDLRLNKRLCKQSWGWWFETLLCPLWRHSNGITKNVKHIWRNSTVLQSYFLRLLIRIREKLVLFWLRQYGLLWVSMVSSIMTSYCPLVYHITSSSWLRRIVQKALNTYGEISSGLEKSPFVCRYIWDENGT